METLQQTERFWAKLCFERSFKPKGRYQIYRELVTERMVDVVKNVSPVARSFLSEAEWWKLLWDFLKHAPPKSEMLREFPYELSQYLKKNSHSLAKKYPFLGELLEYEYLEIQMRFAPEDRGKASRGKLRLNPAHVLATYRWPVHFISEKFHDPRRLPQGRYHMLLWRAPESLEVRFMEVNDLVVSLIRSLEREAQKSEALLKRIAARHGFEASEEFLQEGRSLLRDLMEKDVLL